MKIGIAADHGGFELKEKLKAYLAGPGREVKDFGDKILKTGRRLPGLRRAARPRGGFWRD